MTARGTTLHDEAVRKLARHAVRDGGEDAADLLEVWDALASRELSGSLVDAVFSDRQARNLEDAWVLRWVVRWMALGELLTVEVPVGSTPLPDAYRGENEALLGALPAPWSAAVEPSWDGDGTLRWKKTVRMLRDPINESESWVKVRTGAVPLEIGETRSGRTWAHLMTGAGLARWAYGSENLFIIYASDPSRWAEVRGGPLL